MVKLLLLTQPRFFFPLAHGVFSTRASHYKPAFESQHTEQLGARPATSTQKQPAGTGGNLLSSHHLQTGSGIPSRSCCKEGQALPLLSPSAQL